MVRGSDEPPFGEGPRSLTALSAVHDVAIAGAVVGTAELGSRHEPRAQIDVLGPIEVLRLVSADEDEVSLGRVANVGVRGPASATRRYRVLHSVVRIGGHSSD